VADIDKIIAQLLLHHPVTGTYAPDAKLAAAEFNALNIADNSQLPDVEAMRNFCYTEKFRTRPVYGAIAYVASRDVGSSVPFGGGGSAVTLTDDHVTSARTFIAALDESKGAITIPVTDTKWSRIFDDLALGSGCNCIDGGIKATLGGFSEGLTSIALQESIGLVKPGHILEARG